jgi:hypothetical protein
MPCDSYPRTTIEDVKREESIKDLAAAILAGRVTVARNVKGEPVILNWSATAAAGAGWQESCALHFLSAHGDWFMKQKLAALGITQKSLTKLGLTHH